MTTTELTLFEAGKKAVDEARRNLSLIRHLQRRTEILEAQVDVVRAFQSALAPRGGAMVGMVDPVSHSEHAFDRIERTLEEIRAVALHREAEESAVNVEAMRAAMPASAPVTEVVPEEGFEPPTKGL